MLFLEQSWFGFCWCLVLFGVCLFSPLVFTRDKLNYSHNFGREGVIQSSVLLIIYLIKASVSRHIQQRHTTPARAHNLSSLSYLLFNHPRVLGICPLLLIRKLGATVREELLKNVAYAVLGAEFAIAMLVIDVCWMGTYYMMSEE